MDSTKYRIQSIDLLRGLVMIIMALDHVRDFFNIDSFSIDPTDLSKTNVAFFTTRWITHFCAPVFMFLAGTSAFLMGQKKTKKELSFFLLTRGLWMIFLELTIVAFGWNVQMDFHHIGLQVFWALGACMIFLAGLVWLPFYFILGIGLIIICGHNLLDHIHVQGNSISDLGWRLIHERGAVTFDGVKIFVGYPILSWIGVMALGYCLGQLYVTGYEASRRRKMLIILGSLSIIIFIVLRSNNFYGDAALWSTQSDPTFSFLSFINTTKYPPSLLYILMTLGPSLLFLAFTEKVANRVSDLISIYGRVPMFYYICHLYFIQFGAYSLFTIQGFKLSDLDKGPPPGYGLNLPLTYAVWFTLVLLLYPLCKWYDRYKSSHRDNKWLSYL
jgi:uncharacterized membrane protein